MLSDLPARSEINPADLYLSTLSPESQRTMGSALNTIAKILNVPRVLDVNGRDVRYIHCPWTDLNPQRVRQIRIRLIGFGYALSTARRLLSGVRGVLKAALELGQLDAESYQQKITELGWIKAVWPLEEYETEERWIGEQEMAALLAVCIKDETAAGPRDAILVLLLRYTSLRPAELVRLDLQDHTADGAGGLRIQSGRHEERLAHLDPEWRVDDILARWLGARGHKPGALFLRVRRGGHIVNKRMNASAINYILKARAEAAGIESVSPSDLRRAFLRDVEQGKLPALAIPFG